MSIQADGKSIIEHAKILAFDLDGTLVDAFSDIAAAGNAMLSSLGRPTISSEEVKSHVGRGAHYLAASLLGVAEDDPLMETAYPILYDYYLKHPSEHAKVYPYVFELLEKLHRGGVLLAVTSNKPHPMTVTTLETTGLIAHFDWVRGYSDTMPRKPAPDLLWHLISEAEVRKDECVVIGDTQFDIIFAKNAGVKSIAVTHGQCTRAELEPYQPDLIIDSFKELIDVM
ncbi:HAD-IA family hydrolase [Candidatus Sumerlaeota bacterium]|nr:HAD-IA family hydrolase [Candidatus Sumerlaeota bacterium]